MSSGVIGLLAALGLVAIVYVMRWYYLERDRAERGGWRALRPPGGDVLIGFVTDFFDTLGIGNFAPTTAAFKFLRRMPDEQIPGTLNAGHAVPVIAEALVFISVVSVDLITLVGMIAAAVAGAWLGAGVAARLPGRAIQLAMGIALMIAALLFIVKDLSWLPAGGDSLGLHVV